MINSNFIWISNFKNEQIREINDSNEISGTIVVLYISINAQGNNLLINE